VIDVPHDDHNRRALGAIGFRHSLPRLGEVVLLGKENKALQEIAAQRLCLHRAHLV
jgi:hypothetical protein